MAVFKNKISKALSLHGWDIYKWLNGQKKTAIAGAIILLTFALVNNNVITVESAVTLAGMLVTALLAILEFYLKEVELSD